jgi:hypothetical protein
VKNVLLASADQVAIDAVAAKLMGFDPLRDVKFIRLAHDRGLGCGDPREIEIVGDREAAEENWHFDGPFKRMTFASSMQHKIYWGRLKTALEWSLKTWLAPWAYIASVLYHDMYWYPSYANRQMREVLQSGWGRLFANWERLTPTEQGWPDVGTEPARLDGSTAELMTKAFRILGTCIAEAPEASRLRRRKAATVPPA